MTNQQGAPAALRLAEELEHDPGINRPSVVAELRRLHAENTTLQQGYDAARMEIEGLRDRVQELGAMLRENCNRRIVELEAQLDAIGAGGVEPLRRRECLHQISEPSQPESITDQEIDRIAESMPGGFDGFLKGWGWRQFARAVLEHQTREAPTKAAPNHEAQEPVAWRIDSEVVNGRYITFDEHPGPAYPNAQPLYTAPQPAPAAQWDAEDAARLDWLESQSQVNIERVRYLGADTSIYEVTPFNSTDYNGETLRAAIDSAMNRGDAARSQAKKGGA